MTRRPGQTVVSRPARVSLFVVVVVMSLVAGTQVAVAKVRRPTLAWDPGIEDIARELDRLMATEERRLDVELTTALQLSDEDAHGLVNQIEEASGRKVEVSRKVDPELIGGLILQIGSMRVDASVRGRIERLRRELVSIR